MVSMIGSIVNLEDVNCFRHVIIYVSPASHSAYPVSLNRNPDLHGNLGHSRTFQRKDSKRNLLAHAISQSHRTLKRDHLSENHLAMTTHAIALTSGVFSPFTGSISAINTISTWVANLVRFLDACGEAKLRIQDLQDEVEFRRQDLDSWKRKWKVDQLVTVQWESELWGDKVLQINWKMTRIRTRCISFQEEFDTFFQQPLVSNCLEQAIANGQSISAWSADEAYLKAFKQDVPVQKIINFAGRMDERGKTWVKDMKAQYIELVETANAAFLEKRGGTVLGSLTETQLHAVGISTLVQLALELRNASEELYLQSWSAAMARQAANKSTKLKIDLTGTMDWWSMSSIHSQTEINLIYHLFLQWDDGEPREICIEGPKNVNNIPNASTVLRAYEAILVSEEASILVQDEQVYKVFKSRLPHEEEKLFAPGGQRPITLAQFLQNLHGLDITNCLRIFPTTERIILAFKIVESALLLAGTAWLSNVRSDYLCRSLSLLRGDKYNYTVDLNREATGWRSIRQLSDHMFRVGLVLAEIGCAKQVVRIERDEMFGILKFPLYRAEQDATIETLKEYMIPNMGMNYAKITVFCLQELRELCNQQRLEAGESHDAVDAAYKRILEKYYEEVYEP
jgi:hypothetical protein